MRGGSRALATLAALLAGPVAWSGAESCAAARALRAEVIVDAPVTDVWRAWTTVEGIRTFFAPDGRIEPRVGGAYEIWFVPDAPPGQRGDEDTHVLQLEPHRRLAFSWSAPPSIPAIRAQRTLVVLDFRPHGQGRTLLLFEHVGWGEGPEWDRAYDYFDAAWGRVVLPRLRRRFRAGPIDWSDPPAADREAASMKVRLVPERAVE